MITTKSERRRCLHRGVVGDAGGDVGFVVGVERRHTQSRSGLSGGKEREKAEIKRLASPLSWENEGPPVTRRPWRRGEARPFGGRRRVSKRASGAR